MYRHAMSGLYRWKSGAARKPLIIRGARQVGKTWLMKAFGAEAYESVVYISFDNNQQMRGLFSEGFDVSHIIMGIELYAGHKIDAASTLLIFDEVQEVPQALTSLKYFNETAPEYQILCAGSMLGVALHPGTSFPVGKVEFLDLYPLSFSEFVRAMGKPQLADLLGSADFSMITVFKQELINQLKQYYYVGGMPEAVLRFSESKDFAEARRIQQRILDAYEQDFSKHAPYEIVPRIRMIWNSIPSQLTKESRKFVYGLVKDGARAREFELALMWLADCGLAYKVHRAAKPAVPLKAYEDLKAFKLFMLDVGLLSCMARLKQDILLDGSDLFIEFKGALTEQYVFQQLKAMNHTLNPIMNRMEIYYWTNDRNSAEIDFLLDNGTAIIPLEVKAEINLQAKSLKVYREKYNPDISLRASMADYRREDGLVNVPLYALEGLFLD